MNAEFDNLANNAITAGGNIRAGNGDAATPSISFDSDQNTGLYRVGADDLGLTTGGTLRADWNTTRMLLASGYQLAAGANTLVGSIADKINAVHLAIAAQAIGDLLYADATTTFARLADVADGNVLRSGGVGAAPVYGKVRISGATTDISGTLPATNGGTGLSAYGALNRILGMNAAGTALEYKALSAGSGMTINHTANDVELISSGGGVTKSEAFTGSGTFTPATGVTLVWVTLVGGGGGGGSTVNSSATNGGGGGGGSVVYRRPYVVSPGVGVTVTIGAGGTGGTPNNNDATAGSQSVFDALTASGGNPGLYASSAGTGGVGGGPGGGAAGTAGTVRYDGSGGGGGGTDTAAGGSCGRASGGASGASSGGGGGGASWGAGAAGGVGGAGKTNGVAAAANTGGGGGGAGTNSSNPATTSGGNGGSGYCLVEWTA